MAECKELDQMDLNFLKFRRSETEFDWNYPFDFCGSIYRLTQVFQVLDKIEPENKILKPNTFEFSGNKAIKFNMLAKSHPYSLCLNWPVTTVITVNKVQDIYNTPVYEFKTEETKESCEEDCLLALNDYLKQGKSIDFDYYRR